MSVGPYETQTGDNLSHIATEAGMTEDELEAANPDHPIKTWWRRPILWNEAGAIVWIEGYGGGDGGTGTFDGDHVLTGDPLDPPADLAAGQLLWDGVEGGSGGDAGPHDHDYLPLAGGTLTGDLQVGGQTKAASSTPGKPSYAFTADPTTGIYGNESYVAMMQGGDFNVIAWDGRTEVRGKLEAKNDLQVDGTINATGNSINDLAITLTGTKSGFYGSDGAVIMAVGGNWVLGAWPDKVEIRQNLQVDGKIRNSGGSSAAPSYTFTGAEGSGMYGRSEYLALSAAGAARMVLYDNRADINVFTHVRNSDLKVDGTITDANGPVRAFAVADGIDTADVLDRAETATMPVIDAEGVATADADVGSLTVNEVVTALLLKVKELSARIEELEGN